MDKQKSQEEIQRELIARNIINVLDVKEQNYIHQFLTGDFQNKFVEYIQQKLCIDLSNNDLSQYISKNQSIIDKISQSQLISTDEKNQLFEDLKSLKRKYLLDK